MRGLPTVRRLSAAVRRLAPLRRPSAQLNGTDDSAIDRVDRRLKGIEKQLKSLDRRLSVTEQNAVRQTGRLDYEGGEVLIGITSRTELLTRLYPTRKEPWTVAWIERTMGADDVFWDVGANVGAYALIAAHVGGRESRVVAIEPAPANYAALCDNLVLNDFADRAVALPIVLTDTTELATLLLTDLSSGAGVHSLEGVATQYLPTVQRQATLAYPLDVLVREFGVPAPTLLKIDVDGSEAAVLRGAAESLRRPELRSALVEVEDRLSDEVIGLLEAAGLQLTLRIDERNGKPMQTFWYGVFERG